MLPASKGLNYLPRMASGSTGTPACALFATADSVSMHEGGEKPHSQEWLCYKSMRVPSKYVGDKNAREATSSSN
jgi:hypothetical protein